jgi:hypothetical protein
MQSGVEGWRQRCAAARRWRAVAAAMESGSSGRTAASRSGGGEGVCGGEGVRDRRRGRRPEKEAGAPAGEGGEGDGRRTRRGRRPEEESMAA